jgi:imidazolonepropionase-like amidohydrolase
VTVATGTDVSLDDPWGTLLLHVEIEFLVAAGFTPLEAIRAATLDGARCLGADRDLGSVEVGKLADLILVAGDPARDVRDLRRIVWVIRDGVPYTRDALLRLSVRARTLR